MFDKDAQFHKCGVNFNAFDEYKKLQAELDKHRYIPVSELVPSWNGPKGCHSLEVNNSTQIIFVEEI